MLRKIGNEIIINQDFYGSYGIYIYKNKDENYFALSNSFLLLQEYLVGKQNLSLNKCFADNLIVTPYCSYSIDETLINEINQIPSNAFIVINTVRKEFKIDYINYNENSISLESKEGLELIDNWFDRWVYIFRSLKKKTNNYSSNLSGGFDTRTILTILLNSGIEMDEFHISSILDKKHDHEVDFKIASKISIKYGFKINNFNFDKRATKLSLKDAQLKTLYTKLGFHKDFKISQFFYNKPRFILTGGGGETLRGEPGVKIKKFIQCNSLGKIKGHEKEFFCSSEKIFNRSIFLLKRWKNFKNDYEISYDLYSKSVGRNHFGKDAVENFMENIYIIQPLMDPEIKKIKFDISNITRHDLIAYIYIRFAHDLIYFPFQGKRILNVKSIKKAEKLNKNFKPYKKKLDYNKNFFIDNQRISPVNSKIDVDNAYDYFKELFNSNKYTHIINKLYDNNIYNWANEYRYKNNYRPLRHHYAIFSIAIILNNLIINQKYLKNISFSHHHEESNFNLFNYLNF